MEGAQSNSTRNLDDILEGLTDVEEVKIEDVEIPEKFKQYEVEETNDKQKETKKSKEMSELDELDAMLDDIASGKKSNQTKEEESEESEQSEEEAPKENVNAVKELDKILDDIPDDVPRRDEENKRKDNEEDFSDLERMLKKNSKEQTQPKREKDDLDNLIDETQNKIDLRDAANIREGENICYRCGELIEGQRLNAKGRHYHPQCFICDGCNKEIGDGRFHDKDYKILCDECYAKEFASLCHRCNKPILATRVTVGNVKYHKDCFYCDECKKPLDMRFFNHDNGIYCENCYRTKFSSKCAKCGQVISGAYLSVNGQKYHKECFVCEICGQPFADGRIFSMNGKMVCSKEVNQHQ